MNGKTTDMTGGDGTRRAQGFALLIDADNISLECLGRAIDGLMQRYPCPVRRAYRNFQDHEAWRKFCAAEAILPVQTLNPGAKNAADLALVIDAMDLLHRGGIEGLVIVSDDSDFSRLAIRFREAGIPVIGYGTEKANAEYRAALDHFHALTFPAKPVAAKAAANGNAMAAPVPDATKPLSDKVETILATAYGLASGNDLDGSDRIAPHDALGLSELGQAIRKKHPGFNTKDHGSAQLKGLIKRSRMLELVGTNACRLRGQAGLPNR